MKKLIFIGIVMLMFLIIVSGCDEIDKNNSLIIRDYVSSYNRYCELRCDNGFVGTSSNCMDSSILEGRNFSDTNCTMKVTEEIIGEFNIK